MCAVCRKQNHKEDGICCNGCEFVFHPSCHLLPPLDPKNIPQGDWFCGKCVPIRKEDLSEAEYNRKIVTGGEGSKSSLTDLSRIRQHLLNYQIVRPEYLAIDIRRMYEWQAKTFRLDYMMPKQPGKNFGQKILDYHRHFKLCFDQYFPGLWSEEFDLETLISTKLTSASVSH